MFYILADLNDVAVICYKTTKLVHVSISGTATSIAQRSANLSSRQLCGGDLG
jgi:hypothetical protein